VATAQVVDLSERLKLAITEAEDINVQEKMFGWAASKYGMIAKMISTLEPYRTLWTTVNAFYDNYAIWMNGPFMNLKPEDVEAETSDAFRCAAAAHLFLHRGPAMAAGAVAFACLSVLRSVHAMCSLTGQGTSISITGMMVDNLEKGK
jgi:hypothetical protein